MDSKKGNFNNAARCGAKTRAGFACEKAAMHGKNRCRNHGGASTGARTPEGLARVQTANWKHGAYTAEAKLQKKLIKKFLAEATEVLRNFG